MRTCKDEVFRSDQEINKATLLIKAKFKTRSRFFRFLRKIGFGEILPVNNKVGLELYFENLFDEEIEFKKNVPFQLVYPDDKQIRPWYLNIPNLKLKGDNCSSETNVLFKPEVPGNHKLIISQYSNDIQYADVHGLTDRPYKVIRQDWVGSFYVSGEIEYRPYIIAFLALIVSIIAVVISIMASK